jgi:phosphatidylserine decarboxylase
MVVFAKDGYGVIAKALGISAVLFIAGLFAGGWILYVLVSLAILISAFTLYFFRDPDRSTPEGEHLLIAPADGKVIELRQVTESRYLKAPATQISIFLSPLDVHVNRVPLSGFVEFSQYFPGEYLVAWHEKASELNERSEFGVRHSSGARILFRQITGYVARRIVFHIKEGDTVKAGERFGMMKFGSRMDILVQNDIKLNVKAGDVVVGGETVIGEVCKAL